MSTRSGTVHRGIPFRGGSFRTTHRNLARHVAFVMVQLDSARGLLDEKNKRAA